MGLIGGMARTAVVAGTTTAVSNRVSRRQANRWAAQEQPQQQQQYEEPPPQAYAPPPPPPPPAADGPDMWISCRSWVSCGRQGCSQRRSSLRRRPRSSLGRGSDVAGAATAEAHGDDRRRAVLRRSVHAGSGVCGHTPSTRTAGAAVSRGAGAPPASSGSTLSHGEQLDALTHLLDSGVLTPDEYQELRARVTD